MNSPLKGLFAASLLAALATGAQAELIWEKSEVELHPKPGDQEAVAKFHYTNKTDKLVKITNVRTSCGCTVATLPKNEVAPGESGDLTATLKIGGRSGLQQKVVTVETDDPAQATTNLTLKANVTQAVEVQPPFVFWQSGEEPKAKTITVKAAKEIPITKIDVLSSTPDFTTKVEKGPGAGEFKINIQPKDTAEARTGSLTITPDYPEVFHATMRVMPKDGAQPQ